MKSPVNWNLSRRELLESGLLLGSLSFLAGCATSRPQGVVSLPPDVWPDPNAPVRPVETRTVVNNGWSRDVVSRASWTSAKPNMRVSKPMNGVSRITVHHSAINSSGVMGKGDVAKMIESIRRNHVARTDGSTGAHWVDIGYHYIIDPAGRVWEGRPTSIEGAHVSQTNPHNLGVMLLGNFNEQRPSTAALEALDGFVASQMKRFRVPIREVYTHQELKSTACPGRNLQQYMRLTRLPSGRMCQQSRA
jgi:hypothetical protein